MYYGTVKVIRLKQKLFGIARNNAQARRAKYEIYRVDLFKGKVDYDTEYKHRPEEAEIECGGINSVRKENAEAERYYSLGNKSDYNGTQTGKTALYNKAVFVFRIEFRNNENDCEGG